MRRYSFSYFVGQGFKGLWRNGVMSFASIAVLTSCLVVMGSFALLVFNINHNVEALGQLNEIRVFVDTDLDSVLPDSAATSDRGGSAEPSTVADGSALNADASVSVDAPADNDTPSDANEVISCPEGVQREDVEIPSPEEIMEKCNALAQSAAELEHIMELPDGITRAGAIRDDMRILQAQIYYMEVGETRADLADLFYETIKKVSVHTDRIFALSDLKAKIEGLGVRAELISRESALESQKEKYSEYPDLFASLTENPYNDAFRITYQSTEQADQLEYSLNHLDGRIYRVEYDAEITGQIESFRSMIVLVFSWFMAILFVVSFFVIVNTVKLAVYARKNEISVMYYVGATNFFITVPFVIEGVIIGVFSGVVAFFLQNGLYIYIQKMISDFQFITVTPFASVRFVVLAGFIAAGVLTGVLGSCISLRRYMKA